MSDRKQRLTRPQLSRHHPDVDGLTAAHCISAGTQQYMMPPCLACRQGHSKHLQIHLNKGLSSLLFGLPVPWTTPQEKQTQRQPVPSEPHIGIHTSVMH